MLSAATFESATAKMRSPSGEKMLDQAARIAQATWVLPVPGGPCTKLSRCSKAFKTAPLWEEVRLATRACSRRSFLGARPRHAHTCPHPHKGAIGFDLVLFTTLDASQKIETTSLVIIIWLYWFD